jgi:hypothetical protein
MSRLAPIRTKINGRIRGEKVAKITYNAFCIVVLAALIGLIKVKKAIPNNMGVQIQVYANIRVGTRDRMLILP